MYFVIMDDYYSNFSAPRHNGTEEQQSDYHEKPKEQGHQNMIVVFIATPFWRLDSLYNGSKSCD